MDSQIVALTGSDVIKLNNRIFSAFADGDCAHLTFPNDLVVVKTGKSGNSIYGFKNDGRQVDLTLRVVVGSSDDKFLNGLLALMKNDPAAFTLITGEFTKRVGDGQGNITAITYILSGGVVSKQPEAVDNADGNTDQALAIWNFRFSNGNRSIGN
jgi:hypothetical protein